MPPKVYKILNTDFVLENESILLQACWKPCKPLQVLVVIIIDGKGINIEKSVCTGGFNVQIWIDHKVH